jgi:hypothetical protein
MPMGSFGSLFVISFSSFFFIRTLFLPSVHERDNDTLNEADLTICVPVNRKSREFQKGSRAPAGLPLQSFYSPTAEDADSIETPPLPGGHFALSFLGYKVAVKPVDDKFFDNEALFVIYGKDEKFLKSIDKVALRVNFVCSYRIADPLAIGVKVKNHSTRMYAAVQLALLGQLGLIIKV